MNKNTKKLKRTHSKSDAKQSPSKRQFRNENEKRRRDLFSKLITNLEDLLSIKQICSTNDQNNKFDKASILRQTVQYLQKHRHHLTNDEEIELSNKKSTPSKRNHVLDFSWKPSSDIVNIEEWLQIAIESLNCFLLVVKSNPYNTEIVYVSKNISSYLGYSQHEILNHSLFKFIFPSYHDRLRDYLLNDHKVLESCDVSWKRAISDDYEQCTIIGAFRNINENEKYLMSIVKLNTLDRTLIINNESLSEEFVTHLNIYGKFIFIDAKARQYLGYSSFELIGRTFFDFVHPDDLSIIVRAHQLWKENGNGKSDPYRFLSKGQQWIFLQTYSQVQINSWNGKPESYICTTNIIQSSNDSLQNQLSFISTDVLSNNSNIESLSFPSTTTTTTAVTSPTENPPEKNSSSESEITSFLSHLGSEIYRNNIREKLIERRKSKEAEIRVRQEEIQVIDDMLQFINQYQIKHPSTNQIIYQQTKNLVTEEFPLNVFDTNTDSTFIHNSLSGAIEDFTLPTHVKEDTATDPLSSLFSPLSTTFNIPSPIIPLSNPSSNNDSVDDSTCLAPMRNSSKDRPYSPNSFPS
ncbi:unnamed protein product [Rotaria magnacalcarata]|uniref:Uncharacterized protein n=4 Tax=Rotaria magnacalcarata TaxID=392030 RepID=A0A814HNU0_9BILA|nr:unnamed protein product [Rotaria magnacalcarata]CAF1679567.1 unnamed protein product [Rotaria magnacalcarata]CAF2062973.1 unnamed protein product [Rotaria magnacalcarata]CAF2125823.1 unnamed protein product [Rotaria magnacalcarata]CAF3817758.1 unnamed protein product [Rotaria magnacalcarata]